MRTSSAWDKTPMDPSHAQGCVDVSEPLGTYCRWHNNFLICYIIIYINVNFIYIGLHHHLDWISIIQPSMHFAATFVISNICIFYVGTGDCGISATWKRIANHVHQYNPWNGLHIAKIPQSPVTSPIPRVLIGERDCPYMVCYTLSRCKDSAISCKLSLCMSVSNTKKLELARHARAIWEAPSLDSIL